MSFLVWRNFYALVLVSRYVECLLEDNRWETTLWEPKRNVQSNFLLSLSFCKESAVWFEVEKRQSSVLLAMQTLFFDSDVVKFVGSCNRLNRALWRYLITQEMTSHSQAQNVECGINQEKYNRVKMADRRDKKVKPKLEQEVVKLDETLNGLIETRTKVFSFLLVDPFTLVTSWKVKCWYHFKEWSEAFFW